MYRIIIIIILAFICLVSFFKSSQNQMNKKNLENHYDNQNSNPTLEISKLDVEKFGTVKQFAITDNNELIIINHLGELWHTHQNRKLASNLSTDHNIATNVNHIMAIDENGNFLLWTEEKTYSSTIKISKPSHILPLDSASIAVIKDNDKHKLARIEKVNDTLEITAISDLEVLPDARPIQVNLSDNQHHNGHIAVLTEPDDKTYQHAVLGDNIEALSLSYLDKNTLKPLVNALKIDGLVFEGNKLNKLDSKQPKLVSVLSGNGKGARAVVIELKNNQLMITAQSQALDTNRWQDTFTKADKIYAVKMPHFMREFIRYDINESALEETNLANNLSTHEIYSYETNLVGITKDFILLPQKDYKSLAWMDNNDKVHSLAENFQAKIIQIKNTQTSAYLLLENGDIFIAQLKS